MKKSTFWDKLILTFVFAIIIASIFFNADKSSYLDKKAIIYSKTKVISYNLEDDKDIEIEGLKGKVNIKIRNGGLWVAAAECPDKTCVKCGQISEAGQSIACLPNGVMVLIENSSDSGSIIDDVAK